MPIKLQDTDIAVLNALLKDGRKSLRQISNETGISTPTVKNRFNRLVNLGVIKSISPILDLSKMVGYTYDRKSKSNNSTDVTNIVAEYELQRHKLSGKKKGERKDFDIQIDKQTALNIKCDYCKTPLAGKMYLFKFANFERFFCCNECKVAYKKKYSGRIKAMSKIYSEIKR